MSLGLVLFGAYSGLIQAQDYVTQFKYDARGRLIKVSDNASKEVYYELDDAGNRLSVSDSPPQPTLPIITSFYSPSSVSSVGASITVSWGSTDTTHCELTAGSTTYSNLPTTGSQSIKIYQNTGVTLTCFNGGNSDTEGKLVRLVSGGGGMNRN